ncbi:MAG TPA: hypothetical protein VL403_12545, partial [Candidatus Kryptonia bacterium]|nr:hypothetical protein [Candidatus Kryptonia bacterium]
MKAAALMLFVVLSTRTASAILPGDSNRDDRVSAPDVTALVQILAGAPGNQGADANLDGFILPDDLDATIARLFGAHPGEVTATATASATTTLTPSPSGTPMFTASVTRSPTPTVSPTAGVAATATTTRTAAPNAVAESVAGSAIVVSNGMSAIPSIVTALVSGLQFGGGSASFDEGGAAGACPLGGSATRSCPLLNSTMTLTLTGCTVPTSSGSVVIDGTISVTGSAPCVSNVVLPPWNATIHVTAVFRDPANGSLLTATADLSGSVDPQLGGSCQATGADMVLSGSIGTQFAGDGSVSEAFQNTSVAVAVSSFSQQCVPLNYAMTFNGPATITTSGNGGGAAGEPFVVTFGNFVLQQNATANPTAIRMDGDITAACYGGTVTLQTLTPLAQAVGQPCPSVGVIKVTAPTGTAQLLYLAGGAVGIDTNLDGVSDETFQSCFDSALLLCLAQNLPTASATAVPTDTPTVTITVTDSPTATETLAPTATSTGSPFSSSTPTTTPSTTATSLLAPTPTRSSTPSAMPSNSATATGTSSPTRTPTATQSATPSPSPTAISTMASAVFCDSLPTPIPDNNAAGINNSIVVATQAMIADLNVRLDVTHSFVGDLKVSLTHVETGTSVVLLDRPGIPASVDGCGRDDISCAFDDEAGRVAEDEC